MQTTKFITVLFDSIPTAIIFPAFVGHDEVARKFNCEVIGAGFVEIRDGKAYPVGHSHSLKKYPSKDCEWALNSLLFPS